MNTKVDFTGIDTVMFDLDATLLPVRQKELADAFYSRLEAFAAKKGCGSIFMDAFYTAFKAMKKNRGERINIETFNAVFREAYPNFPYDTDEFFDEYYLTDFDSVKSVVQPQRGEKALLRLLREKGYFLVCATNPVFPMSATIKRMSWCGIAPQDFDYITLHNNSTFCKPSVDYYKEILCKVGKRPEQCLMVGNDTLDDMGAPEAGIATVLIGDYLLDRDGRGTGNAPVMSFDEFVRLAQNAPRTKAPL